jgi:4-diphosphocytidyl-2-C-methyl-D-erythritol kinase
VGTTLLEKAPAKINLTLRVCGRRADGYHELESLVAFADLADTVTLQPASKNELEIAGPFAAKSGPIAENLVVKACAKLYEQFSTLNGGRFRLEKNIPVAAGLGGGSADAAATMRLVARLNGIAIDDPRIKLAAIAVGADVPVCIESRARVMRGVGEILSAPIELPSVPAVLVNPRMALATRDVFNSLAMPHSGNSAIADLAQVPEKLEPLIEFLKHHSNDLTEAACACAPVVGDILGALRAIPGVSLARMSGSGPTCFALFASQDAAATAAERLADKRKDWWVQPANIGRTFESLSAIPV